MAVVVGVAMGVAVVVVMRMVVAMIVVMVVVIVVVRGGHSGICITMPSARPRARRCGILPGMYVVTLTYVKPLEEVDALMNDHVAWLKRHYASGMFLASGRQVPRVGGVILARSGDRAALDAALAADPFVRHGAARVEVVEFTPSMTARGLEALKG